MTPVSSSPSPPARARCARLTTANHKEARGRCWSADALKEIGE